MKSKTPIERVIAQLKSMRENIQSFISGDDDNIWEKDVKACDAAISLLSALKLSGFDIAQSKKRPMKLEMHKQNFLKLCQFMQAEYEEHFNYEEIGYTKDAVLAAQARLQRTTNDVVKSDILQGMLESAVQAIWFVAANLDQSKMRKEVAVPEKEASHAG